MKLRKVSIEVVRPDSLGRAVEDLLVFDARFLGRKARLELQRLLPGLIHASRFWTARFAEKGCLCCRRKKVLYASGGLCDRCHAREYRQMREWYSKRFAGRDVEKEVSALSRRFDAAQALFNGGDEVPFTR
jgi:hypothetical protein